ncbi:hypothetical protein FQR65_LT09096 [Abscondita terminalis]|nr:hypothetical protein FQR65_LT09096 [Abscondita terminalis]
MRQLLFTMTFLLHLSNVKVSCRRNQQLIHSEKDLIPPRISLSVAISDKWASVDRKG